MGESEEALGILGANRMTLGQPRDARAPGGGMEIGQGRRLRQLPGERMLPPTGSDQKRPHRASLGPVRKVVTVDGT